MSQATFFGRLIPMIDPLESVRKGAKKCSSELMGSPGSSKDSASERRQHSPYLRRKPANDPLGCASPDTYGWNAASSIPPSSSFFPLKLPTNW